MASAPITVIVDGLPVTYLPDGAADGCFELRSRGYGVQYSAITVWPSNRHRHLTSGRDTRYLTFAIDHLFQPEFAIYLREIRAAIQSALESLSDPEPIERICRMCDNPCEARIGTGSPRKYCSRSCQAKYLAWAKLAKRLTEKEARTA